MTDARNADWRGRRTKPSEPTSIDGPVPDWKQRKQATPVPVRRRPFKRLILPVSVLILLVVGAVWMYIAARRNYTHFVVAEFLSASEPAKVRVFDTAQLPELPPARGGGLQYTSRSERLTSLQGANFKLNEPHVVVLYVQALLSPDTQGDGSSATEREPEPKFLIHTSSPDLGSEQVTGISRLKELVDHLRQQCRTGLLLILDFPNHSTTWRLGLPHAAVSGTLLRQIEEWTAETKTEEPKLVALVACNAGQISNGGSADSFGRTVFAEAVSRGFSTVADVHPKDGMLTVAEFAEFVTKETGLLLGGLSDSGVQQVQLFPRIKVREEDGKETGDFILLKQLDAPASLQPKDSGSALVKDLDAARRRRVKLQQRFAFRWNPLSWNAAGEYLWRAEMLRLDGNVSAAADRLNAAINHLKHVEDAQNKFVFGNSEIPSGNTVEEINSRWIDQLSSILPVPPSGSSGVNSSDKTETDENSETSSEINQSEQSTLTHEEILRASVRSFPFDAMALPRPSADEVESIMECRRRVERGFESLLAGPELIETTLHSLHRDVLLQADRLFISSPAQDKAGQQDVLNRTKDTADAVSEFAAEWRLTEAALHDAMSRLSGDLRWAAAGHYRPGALNQNRWIDFLTELMQLREIGPDQSGDLCKKAVSLAAQSDSESESTFGVFRLQARILCVAISARGLQQWMRSLDSDESAQKPFSSEQFRDWTGTLIRWRTELKDSLLKQLHEDTSVYVSDLLNTQEQNQQITAAMLRNSLLLSSLSEDQYGSVRRQIESWEAELRKGAMTKASGKGERVTGRDLSGATESAAQPSGDQLKNAWMMQLYSFMPPEVRSPEFGKPDLKNALLGNASAFAAAARTSWKQCRLLIQGAGETESGNARRFRDAMLLSHLLSAFDADELFRRQSPDSLMDAGTRSFRFEYCRCQTEKSVHDRWIHVRDNQKDLVEETWYGQQVALWAKASAEILEKETSEVKVIHELQKQMHAAYDLMFTSTIKSEMTIDLTDQNRTRETINVETSYRSEQKLTDGGDESMLAALTLRASSGAFKTGGIARVADNAQQLAFTAANGQAKQSFTVERRTQQDTDCSPFECRPYVFFRGREWEGQNRVLVNPCEPRKIDRTFPARKPTADVRVVGQDIRPIVFILDRSRSMRLKVGSTEQFRYEVALKTFEDIIERGTLLSPETPVTLKVYGHRFATGNLKNPAYKTLYPDASDDPGPPGAPDKALLDYKNEFRGRLNANGMKDLQLALKYLKDAEPWGSTPLASAITEALNKDLYGESGIVIAITDGEAKDVGKVGKKDFPTLTDQPEALEKAIRDAEAENEVRMAKLKEAVKASQSKVTIVAFDLQDAPGEQEALRDIFKGECGFDVVDAANESEIMQQIIDSLPPRKWTIANRNLTMFGEKAAELGKPVTDLVPAPGYQITFGNSSSSLNEQLELLAGDTVKLRIDLRNTVFRFERMRSEFFSEARQSSSNSDPDRLEWLKTGSSFLNAEPVAGRRHYKAILELLLNHPRDEQPVRQPLEFHMEFRTPAQPSDASTVFSERPKSIVQEFTSERGTPGYTVKIDSWPADSDILIDAWWKMTRTVPDCVRLGSELVQADTAKNALLIGGDETQLPACRVWTARQEDGTIQIRIDPQENKPYADGNAPQDVVVQLGTRGTTGNNKDFVPRELTTEIQQLETGSVIYKFKGLNEAGGLARLEAAFTSLAARKKDAITLKKPLEVKTPSSPVNSD